MRNKPKQLATEAAKLRESFETFSTEDQEAWRIFCNVNRKAIVGALQKAAKRKRLHVCENRFTGEGARGGCFFEIDNAEGPVAMRVGWSCVIVHDGAIPVSWLSEVIAIATGHKDGIPGFLKAHNYGGGYALMVDPPKVPEVEPKSSVDSKIILDDPDRRSLF